MPFNITFIICVFFLRGISYLLILNIILTYLSYMTF